MIEAAIMRLEIIVPYWTGPCVVGTVTQFFRIVMSLMLLGMMSLKFSAWDALTSSRVA